MLVPCCLLYETGSTVELLFTLAVLSRHTTIVADILPPLVSTSQRNPVFNYTVETVVCISYCVTLRGWIKEAARTLRKQDPALPENRALNRCEVCFKQV